MRGSLRSPERMKARFERALSELSGFFSRIQRGLELWPVSREGAWETAWHLPLWVPERDHNEEETDRDLDEVGSSPSHVVGRFVEVHPVARPEGDECPELVAEL